jgi:hypothetical protein
MNLPLYLFLSNACYNQTPAESFHWISIKFNSQLMEDYKTHYSNDDDDEIDWMNGKMIRMMLWLIRYRWMNLWSQNLSLGFLVQKYKSLRPKFMVFPKLNVGYSCVHIWVAIAYSVTPFEKVQFEIRFSNCGSSSSFSSPWFLQSPFQYKAHPKDV